MKKIDNTRKLLTLRRALNKSRHELSRRRKKVSERRLKNIELGYRKKVDRFINSPSEVKHKDFIFPESFSLVDNPDEVITYLENIRETMESKLPVVFNLSHITNMGPETLTYLCALLSDTRWHHNTLVQGNIPEDPTLRKMFVNAGWYNFMKPQYKQNNSILNIEDEMIHRITRRKVESELAGKIAISAMKHTYSDENNFMKQNFYPILIETMANTWNHASYIHTNEIFNWWLLAYKEPVTKITKFVFLDLGIGIFNSLEQKYRDNKLPKILKTIFMPNMNKETLERIFEGERKSSREDLPGRGRGINKIYNLVRYDKNINNFTLISNNVIARIGYNKEDQVETLDNNFEGTLYYWELWPK